MTYEGAVQYINSFIDYEKLGFVSHEPFKLERTHQLAELFHKPQNTFSAIHIAGTKGKGSIASFISHILAEAGFKVGLYTSPHLVDARERIKINNEMIDKSDFIAHVSLIKRKLEEKTLAFSPTFFEIYTILAFNYFRAKKVDYAVAEVGLGGRLDATNIVNAQVSVIAPISYDHMHLLGNTLEEITREKVGIIKKDCTVVSAPQEKVVQKIIEKKCNSLGLKLILVGRDVTREEIYHDSEKEIFNVIGKNKRYERLRSHLLGEHQVVNATSAFAVIEELKSKGITISEGNIKTGIEKTRNPGRCEVIEKKPYVVLDGAQNPRSAEALKKTIKRNFTYKRLILIFGISKDKDIKKTLEELASFADILILTRAGIERAQSPELIKELIKRKDLILTSSVEEAMKEARMLASQNDLILVTGSFFVIGEAKKKGKIVEKEKLNV